MVAVVTVTWKIKQRFERMVRWVMRMASESLVIWRTLESVCVKVPRSAVYARSNICNEPHRLFKLDPGIQRQQEKLSCSLVRKTRGALATRCAE